MRAWRTMLGPFLIWTVHFVAIYGVASIADIGDRGDAERWRAAGLVLTGLCLAAIAWCGLRPIRDQSQSDLARRLGLSGAVIGLVAVAWQSLPLVLSN